MSILFNTSLKQVVAAAMVCGALIATPLPALAQSASSQSGSLYYKLGGGSPGGQANYKNQISVRLGLSYSLRLNYSCGKFDIGASWSAIMNGISNIGPRIQQALQAFVASLPMYIFERAQPGLYKLFKEYSDKADYMISESLKTCEELEAGYKKDSDKFLAEQAKQEEMQNRSEQPNSDVVAAKTAVNKDEEGQKKGVSWVFGTKAGGLGQAPIQPIKDLAVAAYNTIVNRPVTTNATSVYPASAAGSRMANAFRTPQELADFSAAVLGDKQIFLCQGIAGCPADTSVTTAAGLGKKVDEEIDFIRPILNTLANTNTTNIQTDLASIAAPNLGINAQLLQSLRNLPAESRSLATNRLSSEMGLQRVVDKALVARNVLITGLTLPEVQSAGAVYQQVQEKVDRMTQYINDLLFEHRIRKEITSDTALQIMQASSQLNAQSVGLPKSVRPEAAPMVDGRVPP